MYEHKTGLAVTGEALWPPDDTEESVVGSEYHQHLIDAVRDGLRMAARLNGLVWYVLSQIALAGFRRPDRSAYTMLPDVFVHPRRNPHPESGETLTLAELGVPLLAIEVLSPSTYQQDLDERRGKAWSYAAAGVQEYIVVDPTGRYLGEHVRALRLVDGHWAPWPVTVDGRWESAALSVSFEYDELYLRVRDAAGRLMPLPEEAGALLAERDAERAERNAERAERDAERAERDAERAQIRELAEAGDLAAVRALLADRSSGTL